MKTWILDTFPYSFRSLLHRSTVAGGVYQRCQERPVHRAAAAVWSGSLPSVLRAQTWTLTHALSNTHTHTHQSSFVLLGRHHTTPSVHPHSTVLMFTWMDNWYMYFFFLCGRWTCSSLCISSAPPPPSPCCAIYYIYTDWIIRLQVLRVPWCYMKRKTNYVRWYNLIESVVQHIDKWPSWTSSICLRYSHALSDTCFLIL